MPATTAKNAMPNKADATAAAASRTLDCMRLALQARDFTYEGHLDAARWAERRGLEALAIPDHYLGGSLMTRDKPFLDALAVLAGLARETSHIELVLLVSPVTFRHPAVMAKNAATIQEMTDGRLTFGVGLGWLEQEFKAFGLPYPPLSQRWEMLIEALQYLRAAFAEPPQVFEGAHYRFPGTDALPRPALRLVVGGGGARRTPTVAGRFADEFNAFPGRTPLGERIAIARQSAVNAGRDPDDLLISAAGPVVGGEDDAEVRDELEGVAEMLGAEATRLGETYRARGVPIGTWPEISEQLASMAAIGVERYYVQMVRGWDRDQADRVFTSLGG